jgi:hypothetical protein
VRLRTLTRPRASSRQSASHSITRARSNHCERHCIITGRLSVGGRNTTSRVPSSSRCVRLSKLKLGRAAPLLTLGAHQHPPVHRVTMHAASPVVVAVASRPQSQSRRNRSRSRNRSRQRRQSPLPRQSPRLAARSRLQVNRNRSKLTFNPKMSIVSK